jgi:outer membrane biosynthesis protein TonB
VVDASALGVHEESAMAAVRRWRFAPVREGGQPVERRTAVRLRFETGK